MADSATTATDDPARRVIDCSTFVRNMLRVLAGVVAANR